MYSDSVSTYTIAKEVRRDLDTHELSGSDLALDRLEVLLDRIDAAQA